MTSINDPASISLEATIDAYRESGFNERETARTLGISRGAVRRRVKNARRIGLIDDSERFTYTKPCAASPSDPIERTSDEIRNDGSRKIDLVTHHDLTTTDEVLEHCKVDKTQWKVTKCRIVSHKQGQTDADKNPRIVGMINITLELAPREADDAIRVKPEIIREIKQYAPRLRAPKQPRKRNGVMLEVSCPDIHVGKRSRAEETGDDYNIEIAERLYLDAIEDLIDRAAQRYDIEQIVNVPGNDLLHFAGGTYATTNGTRQTSDEDWQFVYRRARQLAADGVSICREVAPTKVIGIPDNHARYESFYLIDALECLFHKDKHVEVDASAATQKFHRFKNVLLGFDHGDCAKPQQLMAIMLEMQRKAFAECSYFEWHLGHLHKEMLIDSEFGAIFRRLPSLSGVDPWHARMGYRNRKSAMAFVYDGETLLDILYFTPPKGAYIDERY